MLSCVRLYATPWTAAHQASLSITNSRSLFKLMSIGLVMPSNYLILCHPLLPPSIFPSIRVFSNKSGLCIKWPKYWSFSISPSNEYSGLISFRMDWLDLLVVQGTLKSLLQHHNSKALILRCSPFFIVQLSHPYMTTGQTITLTRWTFVGKVLSLPLRQELNTKLLIWSPGHSLASKSHRLTCIFVLLTDDFQVSRIVSASWQALSICLESGVAKSRRGTLGETSLQGRQPRLCYLALWL